ncbi:MAG TPA: transglycosylase SLT domain-containing protein [Solirubrobacteraceae bacterium]|nr:transglycosylase SLT domain-containing protein [Solirubrobacteraceae bacterium]
MLEPGLKRPNRPSARRPIIYAAVVLAVVAGAIAVVLGGSGTRHPRPGARGSVDPFGYSPQRAADYERRASAGFAHPLYALSPGGVIATARRTLAFERQITQAAAQARLDPRTLEAIVLLESAGRPDAIAGHDPAAAAGLTQIVAGTATALLGMHVDVAASRRLTARIALARRRNHRTDVARFERDRTRVDDRFDPAKALAATGRYLALARKRFGRDDLAVVSYHMGIGNLDHTLKAYGASKPIPYTQLYFDSTPLRHAPAYNLLASFGDSSSTYYWRILAAREILRLYRADPRRLAQLDRPQRARNSAEEVLHPPGSPVYATPAAIGDARRRGELVALPAQLPGIRIDPHVGELARKLHAQPALYRALRPDALAVLAYVGAAVRTIAPNSTPLVVSSGVRDTSYQRLLRGRNAEAAHGYSLHETGFALDILRRYGSRPQALAFQFLLERLQALDLITWVREPTAIHVVVASDAGRLLPASPAPGRPGTG